MSVIARLIDTEGVVWKELALERAMLVIDVPVASKVTAYEVDIGQPFKIEVQKVRFGLEQIADDGTHIYRRLTGPWG